MVEVAEILQDGASDVNVGLQPPSYTSSWNI